MATYAMLHLLAICTRHANNGTTCIFNQVEAVVVHISMDYKKEVFDKEKLWIKTWINRVGITSFSFLQTIINEKQELVVQAEAILATIDRETRFKATVTNEVRKLMEQKSALDYQHLLSLDNVKCPQSLRQ